MILVTNETWCGAELSSHFRRSAALEQRSPRPRGMSTVTSEWHLLALRSVTMRRMAPRRPATTVRALAGGIWLAIAPCRLDHRQGPPPPPRRRGSRAAVPPPIGCSGGQPRRQSAEDMLEMSARERCCSPTGHDARHSPNSTSRAHGQHPPADTDVSRSSPGGAPLRPTLSTRLRHRSAATTPYLPPPPEEVLTRRRPPHRTCMETRPPGLSPVDFRAPPPPPPPPLTSRIARRACSSTEKR